jgi:hypothetical protein
LQSQAQAQQAGIWPFGGPFNYIEDVFSTWLYTGNGSTQTITNSIDLSTKGGLVWIKSRSDALSHSLIDTVRGQNKILYANVTNAQATSTSGTGLTSFDTTGFSLGPSYSEGTNSNGVTNVSWTFRKQPKFFDIVTYTGNATARTIAHNLGSVPGCIIVKSLSSANDWFVYHRSLDQYSFLNLDTTSATGTSYFNWNSTLPTSTVFSVGASGNTNQNGTTYVAYLFAHNAGGFGATSSDNVISCGSYTGTSADGNFVNLGYEPQFLIIKNTTTATQWNVIDSMRGLCATTASNALLKPNTSGAETIAGAVRDVYPAATGFYPTGIDSEINQSGSTYIYIAIRRGPMKVPTDATKVFAPVKANGGDVTINAGFPVDLLINKPPANPDPPYFMDRLRGGTTSNYVILRSNLTNAELTGSGTGLGFQSNTGIQSSSGFYGSADSVLWLNFRRAPSFFDEVCYTGSNGYQDLSHNLGVTPQMIIIKNRANANDWNVGVQGILGTGKYLVLNSTAAVVSNVSYYGSPWTSTTFQVDGNLAPINQSGSTYVAYLFATASGVSKVGSYTGTGATQTIDCGFTGGARFVLIKRTDSTGDWYVWDTARGMVSGTDPSLLLNSTAAEVNANSIYTATGGFQIVSTAAGINASGGSFIFLAIA